ncbi:MAG: glycosyltransferase [Pseudobacter sp.]|uniref:glycosyltransferase n=1 Tax=Pseudobacter sp. TaxID=2045420 RepID=UPI003F805A88
MLPLLWMRETDVRVTNSVTEEDFEKGCDAIYYNRTIGENILKLQSKYRFKIVVDVDDYWHLDPHHVSYQHHIDINFPEQQLGHLQIADAVTTTHERLADKIYPYNKNVHVIPNAIPNDPQYFPVERTVANMRRIFWQGSITHERDIQLLAGPIKRLDQHKFFMTLAGFTDHPVWHRMVSMYTNSLRMKGQIIKGAPVTEYYKAYRHADVCVCPLLDTPFNNMKSNLKVLEAAHAGLPVIASHVHPYLDMPLLYVKKQTDWFKWLNDIPAQEEMAGKLADFCREHYDYQTISEKRRKVFYD